MDASWVLGPAGVKKDLMAVGVAVGIDGLKVFCEITSECCGGGVVRSSSSWSHDEGSR